MDSKKEKTLNKLVWAIIGGPVLILLLTVCCVLLFADLPSFEQLENPKTNVATEVYSSDMKLLGKWYIENRSPIKFKDLSQNIVNALRATEDVRFESHSGIDLRGLFRVVVRTMVLRQSSSGGGSTITQQLAKNLFPRKRFSSTPDKIITKIKEWITAIKLERNYTKEEIMAMYLNTVDFGSNTFGIQSAAHTFFDKDPKDLNIQESALLIGLLQAPSRYSPVRKPENALVRRNVVLGQMKKYDFIDEETYNKAVKKGIVLHYMAQDHISGIAPYFREYLRTELTKWCEEHKKSDGTPYNLYTDGLKVYTTIDSRMQIHAEEAMREHLEVLQRNFFKHWKGRGNPWGPFTEVVTEGMKRSERYLSMKRENASEAAIVKAFNTPINMKVFSWRGVIDTNMSPLDSVKYYKYFLQCGFMAMNPHNGQIKAWVGGIDYRFFKYDHVKEGKRQVGSTFKPFLYTLAMQEGFSPCFRVKNDPVTFEIPGQPPYTPENAEPEFDGQVVTLKFALAQSLNRISAYLMKQFSPQAVIQVARRMGIESPLDPVPALCLGVPDLSVFEMTGAYCTFANQGVWTEPNYLLRIEDRNGNVLEERVPRKTEAISEETAYLMLNLLQGVVNYGTSARLRGMYKLSIPMAGKTGTTQNHSDGWFMGVTPDLVAGCWVGNEDRAVHFRSMEYGQGARMAMPIYALFMQKTIADPLIHYDTKKQFPYPSKALSVETDCSQYATPSATEN